MIRFDRHNASRGAQVGGRRHEVRRALRRQAVIFHARNQCEVLLNVCRIECVRYICMRDVLLCGCQHERLPREGP